MHLTRRLLGAFVAASLATTALTPAFAADKAPAAVAGLASAASPESVGFSSERLKKLDAAMAKTVADGESVGMTTLLMRHGKVVDFQTYGELAPGRPMGKDSLFRIYSMTKPITGVAMMILYEEGKWSLNDPVTKFIPEFKDLKVMTGLGVDGKPILVPMKRPPTMREIMSHTAGFGYGLADYHYVDKQFREKEVLSSNGLKQFVDRTATIPLMFQPGENWSYSVAVDIQGAIVERITGKTLGQFMKERIFTPLKMNDTFFQVPGDKAGRLGGVYVYDNTAKKLVEAKRLFGMADVPDYTKPPNMESGGGGLVSSTTDYARFCQMLANGGELEGVRVLSPTTVKLMGTNVIPKNVLINNDGRSVAQFNEAVGFGLDFQVIKDGLASGSLEGDGTMSWGGAAGTWFWIDPTNDIVFVGMIQRFAGAPTAVNVGAVSRTMVYSALVDPKK